jgi:hypothetical protein
MIDAIYIANLQSFLIKLALYSDFYPTRVVFLLAITRSSVTSCSISAGQVGDTNAKACTKLNILVPEPCIVLA